jgi:hypothetical protein
LLCSVSLFARPADSLDALSEIGITWCA